jgi:chromosome segregation protein
MPQLKKSSSNAGKEIKLKRWQKNQEISEQKSNQFETQRKIDRNENDLVHLRKEIKRLSEESAELKAARVQLEEKNHQMLSEIDQVKNEASAVNEEITEVRTRIDEEKASSETITEKLATLNNDLESNKAGLMDLIAREAQYKNIYQTTINNKESLQKRLIKIDENLDQAQKEINRTRGLEGKAREQLETIKQEIADLTHQITTTGKQLEQKNSALGQQVKLTQTTELERNTVKSNLNTLKKMEANFEWYRDGVKAIMKPQNTAESSISQEVSAKIIGLMADIIEAKPTFETAVEAVLGDALQYIIVYRFPP